MDFHSPWIGSSVPRFGKKRKAAAEAVAEAAPEMEMAEVGG